MDRPNTQLELLCNLAHWARQLSWKETAISFQTTWDKVYQAVEYAVEWGLKHREIGPIFVMGVDEIQHTRGHKYLTLVYQIDDLTRLLWVGQERTVETFEKFFEMIGPEVGLQNRLRLLRYVETLFEGHPGIRKMRAGAPHFWIASILSPR